MISLRAVVAKSQPERGRPAVMLRGVTLEHARGVLGVVGARVDGTSLLVAVLAGLVAPKSGLVTVAGRSPESARAEIAHVPLDATLPDPLRVEEVCTLASRLRNQPAVPAAQVLAPLGVESLARRSVRSLSPAEVRTVSLAIALASSAKVLLIEEPLAYLEASATAHVREAIRSRAARGAVVLITTASVRDATRLADHLSVMTQGTVAPLPPELAHVGTDGARLRAVVAPGSTGGVGGLVAALASESAVASVETTSFAAAHGEPAGEGARQAVAVVVGGRDLLALASAVNRAASRSRVDLEAIESAVMPLDAIRAALAVRGASAPPMSMPPMSMPPASMPPASMLPMSTPPASIGPPGSVPPSLRGPR